MKIKKSISSLLTTALVAVLYLMSVPAAVAKDVVIHAGQLIDGISKQPRTQMSILITDDRITSL